MVLLDQFSNLRRHSRSFESHLPRWSELALRKQADLFITMNNWPKVLEQRSALVSL